jgi:hypothetical protein
MFDPYHKWLGIPKAFRPPTHYQLLGIAADEEDREVIEEAAIRQTTHVRAYQIGPHADDCTRLLNEIAQARATLLHPSKRKEYDDALARQANVRQATAVPLRESPVRVVPPRPLAPADRFAVLAETSSPTFQEGGRRPGHTRKRPGTRRRALRGSFPVLWTVTAAVVPLLALLAALPWLLSGQAPPEKDMDEGPVVRHDPVPPAPPPNPGPLPPPEKQADPEPPPPPLPGPSPIRVTKLDEAGGAPTPGVAMHRLAVSPDGIRVIAGSVNTAYLADVSARRLVYHFDLRKLILQGVDYSRDGRFICLSVYAQKEVAPRKLGFDRCQIYVYEAEGGKLHAILEGHTFPCTAVAFSPDGSKLVGCGGEMRPTPGVHDPSPRIWDVRTGALLRRLEGSGQSYRAVTFTPDGRRILACEERGGVVEWDTETGASQVRVAKLFLPYNYAAFSRDARRLLALAFDNTMRVWDLESGRVQAGPWNCSAQVFSVALTVDNRNAVLGTGGFKKEGSKSVFYDCGIRLVDPQSGQELGRVEGFNGLVVGLGLSADGRYAVGGTGNAQIRIIDLAALAAKSKANSRPGDGK